MEIKQENVHQPGQLVQCELARIAICFVWPLLLWKSLSSFGEKCEFMSLLTAGFSERGEREREGMRKYVWHVCECAYIYIHRVGIGKK